MFQTKNMELTFAGKKGMLSIFQLGFFPLTFGKKQNFMIDGDLIFYFKPYKYYIVFFLPYFA